MPRTNLLRFRTRLALFALLIPWTGLSRTTSLITKLERSVATMPLA